MDLSNPAVANMPLASPPPGVIPNFVNPHSNGYQLIITVAVCLTLVVLAVFLRLYTKQFVTRSMGWDDFICILAAMCVATYDGLEAGVIKYGFGIHAWNLTLSTLGNEGFKYIFVVAVLYLPFIIVIKASIFALYLRLFYPNVRMRWAIYAGLTFTTLTNAIIMICFPAICSPRGGESYIEALEKPSCYNPLHDLEIATGALNFVSDLYILCLPIPMIWSLQLPTRRRAALMAVFATGSIACAASLATLVVRVKYGRSQDSSYWCNVVSIANVIEMNVGFICACMPTSAPLFRKLPSPSTSFATFKSWLYSLVGTRKTHGRSGASDEEKERKLIASKAPKLSYLELGTRMEGGSQGGVMLEAERAAGMSTFRDNLEAEGEHGDEEKGKVGFNRVWYPG